MPVLFGAAALAFWALALYSGKAKKDRELDRE